MFQSPHPGHEFNFKIFVLIRRSSIHPYPSLHITIYQHYLYLSTQHYLFLSTPRDELCLTPLLLLPLQVLKAKAAQTSDFPDGIPECGADALRFGLLAYTVQGRDVNLDIKRVVGYRQFCNKIWNAFKFSLTYLTTSASTTAGCGFDPSTVQPSLILQSPHAQPRDEWILSRLNNAIEETGTALQNYLFGVATSALHQFFLYDLCDVYLELVKPVFNNSAADNQGRVRVAQAVLYTVMEVYLRLSHPFMPFLTEELYQRLALALHTRPTASSSSSASSTSVSVESSIMLSAYPQPCPEWSSAAAESRMTLLKSVVNGARSVRTEYKVPNHVKADFYFSSPDADIRSAVTMHSEDFCTLAKGNCLRALNPSSSSEEGVPPGCCIKVVSESLSLLVDLTGVIDAGVETQRLQKERERLLPLIDSYRRKMATADYESKVPHAVRVTNSEKVSGYETELEATMKALSIFEAMK